MTRLERKSISFIADPDGTPEANLEVLDFPSGPVVNHPLASAGDADLTPGWRRKYQPIPVFLPGKSYGQRSLADYSP